jgi:hypothetical protein
MGGILFHYLWPRQLLMPTIQPHLKMQAEDTARALSCPVYTEAVRRSVYLVTMADFSITWHGGNSCTIDISDEWQETYDSAVRQWEKRGGTREWRYVPDSPVGAVNGGTQKHQGGLMVNFFTGMSIEAPEGISYLVTRPWNNFQPAWTVQDGIYSSRYAGDFSLNLQIMQTGVPIHFRRGESIATLFFFRDESSDTGFEIPEPGDDRTAVREEANRRFYERKEQGEGYRKQCPMSMHRPAP